MSFLLENPIPIMAVGGLTLAILMGGLLKTGRVAVIWAMLGVAVLMAAFLLLENYVVTEKEVVRQTLFDIAGNAIERDDAKAVVGHVSSSQDQLRREAETIMQQISVKQVKIKNNLTIDLVPRRQPKNATARFNVVLVASQKTGLVENQRAPWFMEVHFRKEGDAWRVESYTRSDPRDGMRERPVPIQP